MAIPNDQIVENPTEPKSEVYYAGDVIVRGVILQSYNGERFDITSMIREINIYENMQNVFVTGDLILADGIDLANNFPIIGRELLYVEFQVGEVESKKLTLVSYKVSDKVLDDNGQIQVYKVHFASPEFVRSKAVKLSKSYQNQTQSEIISDIFNSYLKVKNNPDDFISKDLIKDQETAQIEYIVIPNWNPVKTINWLASRSQSQSNPNDSSFMFWERLGDYQFQSLLQLSQKPPVWTFSRTSGRTGKLQSDNKTERDHVKPFLTLEEITINESFNQLKALNSGSYASLLYTYDAFYKEFDEYIFSYNAEFGTTEHLNKNRVLPRGNENLSQQYPSRIDYIPFHTFKEQESDDKYEIWNESIPYQKRNSQLSTFAATTLSVVIPGNPYIQTGDVIAINLDKNQPSVEGTKEPDEIFSGNYLVLSIRHRIVNNAEYKMYMNIAKDSLVRDLPDIKQQGEIRSV